MDLRFYEPSAQVQEYLKTLHAVCVVGPTAVGKSTIIAEAVALDSSVHLVRSTTSRPQRPGEHDGVDMHFRSKEAMSIRAGKRDYVNIANIFDNMYGTAPEDYSATGISVLPTVASAIPKFRALPFASFKVVFVLPPSYESWQERIVARHITPEQLQLRLGEAIESLVFALESADTLFMLNDSLEAATESFLELVHGELPDPLQQQACRKLVQALYDHVSKVTKRR